MDSSCWVTVWPCWLTYVPPDEAVSTWMMVRVFSTMQQQGPLQRQGRRSERRVCDIINGASQGGRDIYLFPAGSSMSASVILPKATVLETLPCSWQLLRQSLR